MVAQVTHIINLVYTYRPCVVGFTHVHSYVATDYVRNYLSTKLNVLVYPPITTYYQSVKM